MGRKRDLEISFRLEDSIFALLKEKDFSEISVSEICKKAWVSRSAFYRNYHDLETIIYEYFMRQTRSWWNGHIDDFRNNQLDVATSFFTYLLSLKDRILLLHQKNVSYVFEQHVFDSTLNNRANDQDKIYQSYALAGKITGVVRRWIQTEMKDDPSYVASFFKEENVYKVNL